MWLWGALTASGSLSSGFLRSSRALVRYDELTRGSIFDRHLEELRGRTVLLAARDQLTAALALIELDGVVKRMVLCPPELSGAYFRQVIDDAGADALVRDAATPIIKHPRIESFNTNPTPGISQVTRRCTHETEWILLTSGTLGAPKLVLHTLATLNNAIAAADSTNESTVWSTFYDIRRYGGLQIFLRALRGGSMVLSDDEETVVDYLERAGADFVTFISGTPSHWRKALMSGAAYKIAPRDVRLSGEIADQSILDSLRAAYPSARVTHAFASTEAGVAFEVTDGLAGFPVNLLGARGAGVEINTDGGTLKIRSPGTALRYLGGQAQTLRAEGGFVDTEDRVELRNGRYYFVGRIGGVVNVGGLKVHPEEVEAVINSHPWVLMSLVKARRNPIMGAVVSADVVLADEANQANRRPADETIMSEILATCRRDLAKHKVPVMIRIVPALDVSAAGKLVRPNA
jgi:acyl-coenzyme A synthetase/AMP-(fatty) acid ligase